MLGFLSYSDLRICRCTCSFTFTRSCIKSPCIGIVFYSIKSQLYTITGMDFVLYLLQTYLEFSVGSFGSVVKVESVVKEVFVYLRSKSQNRGLVTRSPVNCSPKVKPCYTKLNL